MRCSALSSAFFFFSTLVTGPRRSLSLKLSATRVYEPQVRARLGTWRHDDGVSRRTCFRPAPISCASDFKEVFSRRRARLCKAHFSFAD